MSLTLRPFRWLALVTCLVLAWPTASRAQTRTPSPLERLTRVLDKIKAAPTAAAQTQQSERIIPLVHSLRHADIDSTTLAALTSLLALDNDSVRLNVSLALGSLGPRAKSAAPALLHALEQVDCVPVAGLNSALVIRDTLDRIGAPAPPRDCGRIDPKLPTDPPSRLAQINQSLLVIRTDPSPFRQQTEAMRISNLVQRLPPTLVDDSTFARMVAALEGKNNAVRLYMASSLGLLGPRAAQAETPLRNLLISVDCQSGTDRNLSQAIRLALKRIGRPTSAPSCGPER